MTIQDYAHQIIFDNTILGDRLVQPARKMAGKMANLIPGFKDLYDDLKFYREYRDRIPAYGKLITHEDAVSRGFHICDFQIMAKNPTKTVISREIKSSPFFHSVRVSKDQPSKRFIFSGDRFNYKDSSISKFTFVRLEDKSAPQRSPLTKWVCAAAYQASKMVFLATLSIPSIGLAAIGCLVKTQTVKCKRRVLRVEEIDLTKENHAKFGKIAREWQDFCHERKPLPQDSDQIKKIFEDSRNINKLIAQCFERPQDCNPRLYNRAFVCRDNQGIPQALALIREFGNDIKIAHMATNPRNIRSESNKYEYTRMQGAGTFIIDSLFQQFFPGKSIILESVTSAIPFYKKNGFEEIAYFPVMEWGTTAMVKRGAQLPW